MESLRRTFCVNRKDIHYIRSTLESYDGMALVRTVDPHAALLEVRIAPGCEEPVMDLVDRLAQDEGLCISPTTQRFAFLTMGCQMNAYDSDYAAQCLMRAGLSPAAAPEEAGVVIINTCSVRAKAEQKAFSTLGRMAALKQQRPGMILVFAGCVAQQEGGALAERFPELDVVVGTRRMHRIASLVERARTADECLVEIELDAPDPLPAPPPVCPDHGLHEKRGVKGFITIMQGCNNFCSYCIVPYVRGREKSRSPEEIALEAEHLLARGAREITLLGQNVNSYAWSGKEGAFGFPDLLRRLDGLSGLERLRFTTSHPKDLTEDLIQCFAELEHLCGHIHLPFQAGSDRVLERMNRRYTREAYLGLVERLREVRPGMAITADVMVGFPGESHDDFLKTLSLIRDVRFDNLYSFMYSDRRGTAAAGFSDKVGESEKAARLQELQALQKAVTLEKNRALEGSVQPVLVEGRSRRGGQLMGRTDCNRVVNFTSNHNLLNDIVDVLIEEGCPNSLRGSSANRPCEPS